MRSATRENYLKGLFELQQEQPERYIAIGHLARLVGVTSGTCTSMVKKLHGTGEVDHKPYIGAKLTRKGLVAAADILRRHRIMELFLVEVVGLDWADVHAEADQLEHAVSPRLLNRLDQMLGYPESDPHGDPIPDANGNMRGLSMLRLPECAPGHLYRIARVLDEATELLRYLGNNDLKPGTMIMLESVCPASDSVAFRRQDDNRQLTIGLNLAHKLMVDA